MRLRDCDETEKTLDACFQGVGCTSGEVILWFPLDDGVLTSGWVQPSSVMNVPLDLCSISALINHERKKYGMYIKIMWSGSASWIIQSFPQCLQGRSQLCSWVALCCFGWWPWPPAFHLKGDAEPYCLAQDNLVEPLTCSLTNRADEGPLYVKWPERLNQAVSPSQEVVYDQDEPDNLAMMDE